MHPRRGRWEGRLQAEPGRHLPREAELASLVAAHQGFVFKIAREYSHLGVPIEDLVNEGNIGILEAVRRFDHLRGTRFLTYAGAWIRKYILAAVGRYARLVRLPPYRLRGLKCLLSAERALTQKLGRPPSREELASSTHLCRRDIELIQQYRSVEVSIDLAHQDTDSPFLRVLPDLTTPTPEEDLLRDETYHLVHDSLARLSARERAVLLARYGLTDGKVRTLREVAASLGLSRERIRQIESAARQKIAHHLVHQPPRKRRSPASRGRRQAARLP
ncbi:MAG: sigma-70 family RNA polymerase sigma factor [Acidobacteriota bacterium]